MRSAQNCARTCPGLNLKPYQGVSVRVTVLPSSDSTLPPALEVRVYPNFVPLTRFALFSADQASRLVGAHLKRRRGEGTDFHQMREYRVGDSMRQIDWKATSRARKLISREYQDEKNQQLVLVLDTGRRMLAREDGLAHFDHALNAALVVAYLALRQGDAAGLLSTGEQPRWVPPRRGMAGIDTLLRAAYDLQPSATACDYLAMASELSARQRRRALVMLVTNVRDEDIEETLTNLPIKLQKIGRAATFGSWFQFYLCGIDVVAGNGKSPVLTQPLVPLPDINHVLYTSAATRCWADDRPGG